MRLLVIANPVSGGGRARSVAERLGDRLDQRGHDVELFLTRHAGDAAERVAGAGDHERLVVVGGDGTLNEVLNGLPDPSLTPLVHVAMGTANILAHELKLPRSRDGVVRLIEEGQVRRIDMGLAGQRRFLMVASAGFDARVAREVSLARGGRLGYRGYVAPLLRVLRSYERPSLEVTVDGGAPMRGGLAIVSNTRNYGGLFTLADRACCDSGRFDVCVLREASYIDLVHAAARGLSQRGLSRHRGTIYSTGTRVRIDSAAPVDYQVDGDWSGSTPVELELVPAHVPVVTPPPHK